jgi:hypothetical protein
LALFESKEKELERTRLEFSFAKAKQSLADAPTEERKLKHQKEVDEFSADIRKLDREWRERYAERKRELERDFPLVSSTTVTPFLEESLPDFQSSGKLDVVGRTFSFVPPTIFQSTVANIVTLLSEVPIDEGRKIRYPALIGPMGIGKTRTCEEICNSITHERSLFELESLIMRVNIEDFKTAVHLENKGNSDILAQALIYSANPMISKERLQNVNFDVVKRAILQDPSSSSKEIILHLDEIQGDRKLVQTLIEACDVTVRIAAVGLVVFPILSGLTSPSFKTLPSGSSVEPLTVKPLALEQIELITNFVKQYKCPPML